MNPVLITDIKKFRDERGIFYESYKKSQLAAHEIDVQFVQDNQSDSYIGTVRGLHYQWDKPMGKLVRVSKGEILDVIVNIKAESSNFGEISYFFLSEENCHQLWIPPGFAHGFAAITDATVHYKCSTEYNKAGEGSINPLDPHLKINWNIDYNKMILSFKDKTSQCFNEYKSNPRF